jgi:putative addiction module component (TIGR02574 family)
VFGKTPLDERQEDISFVIMTAAIQALQKLPLAERVQAVEDLWDSIAEDSSSSLGLSSEQIAELDERLDHLAANPHDQQPWEMVKSNILGAL